MNTLANLTKKKHYINAHTCALFTQVFTSPLILLSAPVDDLVNIFSSSVGIQNCHAMTFQDFSQTKCYRADKQCASPVQEGHSTTLPSHPPVNLGYFSLLDYTSPTETVSKLKLTTCCLDILPSNFLKTVLNCIAPDVLQIIITSLQAGQFPQALKTTVIKPFLKNNQIQMQQQLVTIGQYQICHSWGNH